jgi:hypothetical protein
MSTGNAIGWLADNTDAWNHVAEVAASESAQEVDNNSGAAADRNSRAAASLSTSQLFPGAVARAHACRSDHEWALRRPALLPDVPRA